MRSTGTVRIPGSTSNLGPGFDALGVALNVYLEVSVEPGEDRHAVIPSGVDAERMPIGGDNLILRVLARVAERRDRELSPVRLRVQNGVPLARGLGSSATAILAGISCYEIIEGERLTSDEIFDYAWEFEPHADNLAAALFGGLVVSATSDSSRAMFLKLPVARDVSPVVVIPDFEVRTDSARKVLPASYSRTDAVFNIQRSALVVGALSAGRWDALSEAMKDRLHQPYRASLVPGLEQVLALRGDGLYGIALSGAGPTILALTDPARSEEVGLRVSGIFRSHGVSAATRVLEFDTEGRRFL